MSNLSNDQGRAYEYICLLALEQEISKHRAVEIIENSSLEAARNAWNNIDTFMQSLLKTSALAVVNTVFEMEPMIVDDGDDALKLCIQADSKGKTGDVRDILIARRSVCWEIGLSLKHNHFAVKHSRLSKNLDFGKAWFGVPCTRHTGAISRRYSVTLTKLKRRAFTGATCRIR